MGLVEYYHIVVSCFGRNGISAIILWFGVLSRSTRPSKAHITVGYIPSGKMRRAIAVVDFFPGSSSICIKIHIALYCFGYRIKLSVGSNLDLCSCFQSGGTVQRSFPSNYRCLRRYRNPGRVILVPFCTVCAYFLY